LKKDYKTYLSDILENIERAERFASNLSYDQLINDDKTCYAIVRCIEIMGEAARHIPDNIRNRYPEVPWKDIVGMRDIIVHSYSTIDYPTVWSTLKNNLPQLRKYISTIINSPS
jgi:uncharacterized protein with HEPN domain